MTTFTLTVDDRTASLIRRVATQNRQDETLAATQLLQWAATHQAADNDTPAGDEWDDEATFQRLQDAQVRQIFERNEW